jgi:hypothetical protein
MKLNGSKKPQKPTMSLFLLGYVWLANILSVADMLSN